MENLKSVLSPKYLKKLSSYENMLYSSNLAEDLYISFLEDSVNKAATESVLEAIFTQGLQKRNELSDNFVETVKSFHQNGFESTHLNTLVDYLRASGYDVGEDPHEQGTPFGLELDQGEQDGQFGASADDDEEFMRKLKGMEDSGEELL